jgi:septation ring formation regulator EzrA
MDDSQKLDQLLANMATKDDVSSIQQNLSDIKKEIEANTSSINGLMEMSEKRFNSLQKSVSDWTYDIDQIRDNYRKLETRVAKLEKAIAA